MERQAIFFRRLSDPLGPWTADPILREYRFTNAYRATDRVSQYLIRNVQRRSDRAQTPEEIFFRTLLFKVFNRIETWETIEQQLGAVSWKKTNMAALKSVLDRIWDSRRPIYSAAYIMSVPPFGFQRKHDNHLALLVRMMKDHLPKRIWKARSLRSVYESFLAYAGIGRFLAFQYSIDLNYSDLLDFDEADFVKAGPGALDGISKCFSDFGGMTPEQIIHWTADRQDAEFGRLGLSFRGLFGRRLQPVDCQNLFCEVAKYARVAHPLVQGVAGRTRIKQSYRRDPQPLPPPLFPERWGLGINPPAPRLP